MVKRIKRDSFYYIKSTEKNSKSENPDDFEKEPHSNKILNNNIQTKHLSKSEIMKQSSDTEARNNFGPKGNRKCRKQQLIQSKFEDLKLLVENPSTVQVEDVSAPNPLLHNKYKNIRNAVSVPGHWKLKRMKFIAQESYELPYKNESIKRIRKEFFEIEDQKSLKERENQKKYPKVTNSDLALSTSIRNTLKTIKPLPMFLAPGSLYDPKEGIKTAKSESLMENITEDLRKALVMTKYSPPPWLHLMQNIGPPPGTNFKIPGVNCDIPKNCKYGYEKDGWGELPMNANNEKRWVYDGDSSFSDVYFKSEMSEEVEDDQVECEIKIEK